MPQWRAGRSSRQIQTPETVHNMKRTRAGCVAISSSYLERQPQSN